MRKRANIIQFPIPLAHNSTQTWIFTDVHISYTEGNISVVNAPFSSITASVHNFIMTLTGEDDEEMGITFPIVIDDCHFNPQEKPRIFFAQNARDYKFDFSDVLAYNN